MNPRMVRWASLAACLWLVAGFVAGWTLREYEQRLGDPARKGNPEVHRLVRELGLDARQRQLLSTALEGNRQRIAVLTRQEESLNPWSQKKISEIREELDFIIQRRILTPEQQHHYWALRNRESAGQER